MASDARRSGQSLCGSPRCAGRVRPASKELAMTSRDPEAQLVPAARRHLICVHRDHRDGEECRARFRIAMSSEVQPRKEIGGRAAFVRGSWEKNPRRRSSSVRSATRFRMRAGAAQPPAGDEAEHEKPNPGRDQSVWIFERRACACALLQRNRPCFRRERRRIDPVRLLPTTKSTKREILVGHRADFLVQSRQSIPAAWGAPMRVFLRRSERCVLPGRGDRAHPSSGARVFSPTRRDTRQYFALSGCGLAHFAAAVGSSCVQARRPSATHSFPASPPTLRASCMQRMYRATEIVTSRGRDWRTSRRGCLLGPTVPSEILRATGQ